MDRGVKDKNMPIVLYCMCILHKIGGESGDKVDVNPRGTVDAIVSSFKYIKKTHIINVFNLNCTYPTYLHL
jgi:hypothetical protein